MSTDRSYGLPDKISGAWMVMRMMVMMKMMVKDVGRRRTVTLIIIIVVSRKSFHIPYKEVF
jgi:hypothetical protein